MVVPLVARGSLVDSLKQDLASIFSWIDEARLTDVQRGPWCLFVRSCRKVQPACAVVTLSFLHEFT